MSGPGGGGGNDNDWRPAAPPSSGAGGSGGGDGGNDPCALIEKTILNSPNPVVISTLSVGDVLIVDVDTSQGKRVVAKANNQIAGTITSVNLVRIISCIEDGYSYKAVVLGISGGKVDVEISPL